MEDYQDTSRLITVRFSVHQVNDQPFYPHIFNSSVFNCWREKDNPLWSRVQVLVMVDIFAVLKSQKINHSEKIKQSIVIK